MIKTFENTAVLCNNTGLTLEKSHLSALNVVQVLMLHDWNHKGEKQLKCTQCDKNLWKYLVFMSHNTGLTLEKSHLSALNVVQVLMLHDWNHTREKQLKSTQCDKTFEHTAVLCNNTGLTLEKSHLSALSVLNTFESASLDVTWLKSHGKKAV